jgi:hypothetical protein
MNREELEKRLEPERRPCGRGGRVPRRPGASVYLCGPLLRKTLQDKCPRLIAGQLARCRTNVTWIVDGADHRRSGYGLPILTVVPMSGIVEV